MKYYSILIGSNGILIKFNKNYKTVRSIFIKNFNEEIETVKKFFLKNKRSNIVLFLDNIGQNYNHKKFPNLMPWDLIKIVNRKFNFEIPITDLRAKIFLGKNKETKDNQFIFISSTIEEVIKQTLDFIETIPNIISGIYMFPLESQNFVKSIFKKLNLIKKNKPKWTLLLIQNKISGIRQIVFKGTQLMFTRFLESSDNDFENKDLKTKILFYENDIIKTISFIKRFSTDFKSTDLIIISLTNNDIKNIFTKIHLQNIKTFFFTPAESKLLVHKKIKIDLEEQFFDNILEKSIIFSPKVFKFFTLEMKTLQNLLLYYSIIKYLFIIIFCIFAYFMSIGIFLFTKYKISKTNLNNELQTIMQTSDNSKKNDEMLKSIQVDFIVDNAILYEVINNFNNKILDNFDIILKNQNLLTSIQITNLKWELLNFNNINILTETNKYKNKISVNFNFLNPDSKADVLIDNYNNFTKTITPIFSTDKLNFNLNLIKIENLNLKNDYLLYPSKFIITDK